MAYLNFFSTNSSTPTEVFRIGSNGNIGIGTGGPSQSFESYNEWADILELAKTNPAVKSALDRLRTTYYLSKEDGNKG
jgi:hypothetical protein